MLTFKYSTVYFTCVVKRWFIVTDDGEKTRVPRYIQWHTMISFSFLKIVEDSSFWDFNTLTNIYQDKMYTKVLTIIALIATKHTQGKALFIGLAFCAKYR